MIVFSDIKMFLGLPFKDYLKLDGFSYSWLRREQNGITTELDMTEGIELGKLVDAIRTSPNEADIIHPLYPEAKMIAYELSKSFGKLTKHFECQTSFTANATFNGFVLPVRGRTDYFMKDVAVLDLKCTKSKNIRSVIEYMKYKEQIWLYAKLAQVSKGYLLVHSVPLKKTELIKIDCRSDHNDFFAEKIISFGKVESLNTYTHE